MENRSAAWLEVHAAALWQTHFSDVPPGLPLHVKWGIRAYRRFGSIAARSGQSVVRLNALFAKPEVPEFVIDAVLAHEFAHYAHGFGSGLPQKYRHAHRGGVVEAELAARGLLEQDIRADAWLKTQWEAVYQHYCPDLTSRRPTSAPAPLCPASGRTLEELTLRLHRHAETLGLPPYPLGWLASTRRHTGMSYSFPTEKNVRLHPLLADSRVPEVCVDLELIYWLTRFRVGSNWGKIAAFLRERGFQKTLDTALAFKRTRWPRLLKADGERAKG